MTATASGTTDNKTSIKARPNESAEQKVASNQIADPAKLVADSIGGPPKSTDRAPAVSAVSGADKAVKPATPGGEIAIGSPPFNLGQPGESGSTALPSAFNADGFLQLSADPTKLSLRPADSSLSLGNRQDALQMPFSIGSSSLYDPLTAGLKPASSYLSFDNSIYNACKITDYSTNLFDLTDPGTVFGKLDSFSTMPSLKPSSADNNKGLGTWTDARREMAGKVANMTFDTVFDDPGDKEKVEKFNKTDNPEAAAILKGHKPGEEWKAADGSICKATDNGGLVKRKDNGDIEYYGKDGSSYTKIGKEETWSHDGETISKEVDDKGHATYKKTFGDGTSLAVTDQKDIKSIERLERVTVTQYKSKLTESRAAFLAASAGVNQHSDGQNYVKDNATGDRLWKDEKHDYSLLGTRDGKFYALQNGHVYAFDMDTHRFAHSEIPDGQLPASLRRNADGSLQFDSVQINAQNALSDSNTGVKFNNRDKHIHTTSGGQDVDLTVDNGKEITRVGDRVTTYDADHDKLAVTVAGKPDMSFDFNTETLTSDGISFTADATNIDGVCSINENTNDVTFDDGSRWTGASAGSRSDSDDSYGTYSQTAASELHATVAEAAGLSAQISSPGSQSAVLAQLYSILGKLDGIGGGIEIQAAVAASKGAVAGQISRAEAIGAMNDRLFSEGRDNSTIAEAISRRGAGTTDESIVRQILTEKA